MQKIKNIYHLIQAMVANLIYGFPSRKLTIIGVTGTDGKTTTASFIYQILKASGRKAALISTVGVYIGDRVYDVGFHVTNPASFPLQKFIRKVVDEGNDFLVLEVTSHGLDQNRVFGIHFQIGVLTNITHEHLDYHRTYEEYAAAKKKLFLSSDCAVLNMDDKSYDLIKASLDWRKVVSYSLIDKDADVTEKGLAMPFTEKFNRENLLAAVACCRKLNIPETKINNALRNLQLPVGRLEKVYEGDFTVIIDFAHTPNALEQVLPEVRKATTGRLIHIFGAAAKRDESKRPLMGQAAAKYDDIVILTAEDPRGESVGEISRQIASGMTKFTRFDSRDAQDMKVSKCLTIVEDRKEAIMLAISLANTGDTVLLTGKAHEKSMNYGHGEEPWDEFEVVKKAINSRS
jgi:UDP-N-acetylmuramoyl-L-alanyl-D-glutamate--2,6-diaminopimelate ligase